MPIVDLKLFFLLKMILVWLLIAAALAVAGSKIEATDGQNVTIYFDIDEVEKADQVMIIFKGDNEGKRLIAQIPWHFDDPPPSGVSMDVEKGRVCVSIQKVSNSSSGIYEARALIREKMFEVKAQLVVKEAPFPTSPAPEHPPTPKPPNSPNSELLWLIVIPLVMIIVISGVVCFRRCRRFQRRQKKELKNNCNGSGGNAEALLAAKTPELCSNCPANSKSSSV